ncbi:hypothetical protein AgCh_006122 [Apium graveolens]
MADLEIENKEKENLVFEEGVEEEAEVNREEKGNGKQKLRAFHNPEFAQSDHYMRGGRDNATGYTDFSSNSNTVANNLDKWETFSNLNDTVLDKLDNEEFLWA